MDKEKQRMIRLGIALPVGLGLLLAGEVDQITESFPYSDIILQGGALSVLAWAVWHAYKNLIPELRREIAEDRIRYMTGLDKLNDGFQKTLDSMADRHERTEQATADRHERWEIQRHADSEKLESTLQGMTAQCARTQARLVNVVDTNNET